MVGSGVFKKIAPMSAELGSALWVLLAWLVAGLVSWFGALTNAEVGSQITEPGGQYEYFKRIFGKPIAFFYGWTAFTVIQSATAAAVASVFAQSVHSIFPFSALELGNISISVTYLVKLLAIMVVWLVTCINLLGVQHGEKVNNLFTSTVVVSIILIIGLCFFGGSGSLSHFTQAPEAASTQAVTMSSFFLAMLAAFWAYEGWNNLGFLAGEIRNPSRNVPLGLALGVGFVMVIYVAINAAYLYVLPVEQFNQINQQENSIAAVVVIQSFLGPIGSTIIACAIMVATFGTTNNTVMSASRVYFAMARDGLFFKKAGFCHPKYDVPTFALIYQSIWASVLIFSGSFDQLTDMLIFAAFIFYGTGAAAVFVLRKRYPNAHRPFKVPGYPIVPGLFIIFCAVLVVNSIVNQPKECGMGLLLIASGIPFYLFWTQKSTQKTL